MTIIVTQTNIRLILNFPIISFIFGAPLFTSKYKSVHSTRMPPCTLCLPSLTSTIVTDDLLIECCQVIQGSLTECHVSSLAFDEACLRTLPSDQQFAEVAESALLSGLQILYPFIQILGAVPVQELVINRKQGAAAI